MQPAFSQDAETERSLRHSLKDAVAYATMIGAGETYVSAFALFLKATTPQIGLLASLPPLLASFVQLFSAWLGHLTVRRKAIILAGAGLQAIMWLPLLALPLMFPGQAIPLLIGCAVLYHCGANLAAPQWSSLMGDIVPERRRGRFFALRTRLISATTFAALLLGGTLLHLLSGTGDSVAGFVMLFALAASARLVSVYQLARIADRYGHVAALEFPGQRNLWRRLRHSNFARFSLFHALMQFSVAIASPFFTVYMLRDLGFSYFEFTLNSAATVLAQFLTLARWGRISDVFGNRLILATTAAMIPFMPLLWLVSSSVWYLIFVQAISGFAWAGFSLSASNFLYDLIQRDKRATYMAVHNVFASIGVFSGAVLGGYLGLILPVSVELLGRQFDWLSPLLGVFLISSAVRALVVVVLVPRVREVRTVRSLSVGGLVFRVMRLNALSGLFFDIVGPRLERREQDEDLPG